MGKRALICGISGQDGGYLAERLLGAGYEVWGSSRDADLGGFENLHRLGIYDAVRLVSLNPRDTGRTIAVLRQSRPDEVFSLAGQSSVGLSFEQPVETMESIALGTVGLLEAIRLTDPEIRFYNAGSTECFGDTGDGVANEDSQFHPRSPYGVAKASACWAVANYREAYGIFACSGILSNHDSPFRPRRFVTRKIIHAVASLGLGKDVNLTLGNLEIERDWGWAPDYVDAIARMLEQSSARDLVIATGQSHTLTEFVDTAFRLIGRDWREHVTLVESLRRPTDIVRNKVDPSRAAAVLGWKAKHGMKEVIAMMLEAERKSLREERAG
jgi:GDPmannose 4,6-dehydratase